MSKTGLQSKILGVAGVCACVGLAVFAVRSLISHKLQKGCHQRFDILVKGDVGFQKNVYDCLAVLERASPANFFLVTQYISVVCQDDSKRFSDANIWISPPVVDLTSDAVSNLQWCASGLVHEAIHIKQMEHSKLQNGGLIALADVLSTNAEIQANAAQTQTLRDLGAPGYMVDYVRYDEGRSWLHCVGTNISSLISTYPLVSQGAMKDLNPALWADLQRCRRGTIFAKPENAALPTNMFRGGGTHYDRGVACLNAHDWSKAISEFDEWIRDNPSDSTAFEYRGGAYFGKRDLDHALADFSKAIEIGPTSDRALYSRGVVHSIRKEFTNALVDLSRSLALNPTNALAYRVRGSVYAAQREFERALEDLDEALRLNPSNSAAMQLRGQCHAKKGEFEKAIRDFTDALQADSVNAAAYNDLAWLLTACPVRNFRNPKRAADYARKACDLTNWQDWKCLDTLAAALAQQGDFMNAVKYEEQALAIGTATTEECTNLLQIVSQYRQNNPNRDWE